jgi:hypothetical protein
MTEHHLLGAVALERIDKRQRAAAHARKQRMPLNDHTIDVLLTEMRRLIDAHLEALDRIHAAQNMLDPTRRLP